MKSVRRDWALLVAVTALFAFGFAVYNGIFQNFARERLAMEPNQLGLLESLREVPGLLTAFTAGTLVVLAEPRLGAIALAICGLGIGATGQMGSYWPLVGVTVFCIPSSVRRTCYAPQRVPLHGRHGDLPAGAQAA